MNKANVRVQTLTDDVLEGEPVPAIEMLTPHEARALRLACIFGTPDPTPPEIVSALKKIKAIEQGGGTAALNAPDPEKRVTRCRACEDGGSNHADFCEFRARDRLAQAEAEIERLVLTLSPNHRPWPPAHPDVLDLIEGALFVGPLILLSFALNGPRWLMNVGQYLMTPSEEIDETNRRNRFEVYYSDNDELAYETDDLNDALEFMQANACTQLYAVYPYGMEELDV